MITETNWKNNKKKTRLQKNLMLKKKRKKRTEEIGNKGNQSFFCMLVDFFPLSLSLSPTPWLCK